MSEVLEILTRDLSSGRIHKRFRVEGTTDLLTYEACNADSAGGYEVVSETDVELVPFDRFCKRCFAEPAD